MIGKPFVDRDYYITMERENYRFLDTIDLIPYMKKFNKQCLSELMDYIEDEEDIRKFADGYVLNFLSEDEFETYLKNRYEEKISFREHIESIVFYEDNE